MFTGLVADRGRITSAVRSHGGALLTVQTRLASELSDGDSVAVNGVCLTATKIASGSFEAEVMNETLSRSSLAEATDGVEVNLELPLRASDRFGGHMVQGHIDGVGTITAAAADGFAQRLEIEAAPGLMRYVVHKGSIAVDGVSLTVAELDGSSFTVSLIPETLERTNLGRAGIGTRVNLEVDVLAKYVEKLLGGIR